MIGEHGAGLNERGERATGRTFSVESANEALALVRPVVRDIVAAYQELMRLRAERQELALLTNVEASLAGLRDRIERATERVQALQQELVDVGCELRDPIGGLVDFPAVLAERRVWLCWKLGEPEVAWWHELNGGFAGRKPIDAEFREQVRESATPAVERADPA
jgi:hypothetical protein